jgi:hypothetical protein
MLYPRHAPELFVDYVVATRFAEAGDYRAGAHQLQAGLSRARRMSESCGGDWSYLVREYESALAEYAQRYPVEA